MLQIWKERKITLTKLKACDETERALKEKQSWQNYSPLEKSHSTGRKQEVTMCKALRLPNLSIN